MQNVDPEVFYKQLKKLNSYLPYFPCSDTQEHTLELAEDKIINILDSMTLHTFKLWQLSPPISSNQKDTNLLEVIFVPLLVFDKLGHRVGYGGGYYDKFLGNIKDDILKIGLSLFEPIDKIQDIEKHDISLDYTITPKRVYDFTLV